MVTHLQGAGGGGGGPAASGCCNALHLSEDNARFVLLAVVLLLYMVAGAALFQFLEQDTELAMVQKFWDVYSDFQRRMANESSPRVDMGLVHELLYAYGNASAVGLVHKRRRWDFAGSFHFVGTIVSTIGYGSTTPQTEMGRLAVILYGFLGCSGGILFFNLFLERIITFLAYALRYIHVRKLSKRVHEANGLNGRKVCVSSASLDDDEESLDNWKPSVYWVMLCLSVAATVVAACASLMYAPFEHWSFLESIYFCFVSFATIGFGDYVATQAETYPHDNWYRFGNFIFLVLGCCCTYSLFNVTSIVIKQALNWLIARLDFRCERAAGAANRMWRRQSQRIRRRRKSTARPNNLRRQRRPPLPIRHAPLCGDGVAAPNTNPGETGDSDSVYDSDGERRLSGEMISMKDFLQANKVSLAVMQKQLYETAQMQRWGVSAQPARGSGGGFTPGTVGPLAIVSQKLDNNA
ncbi:potassium channel subfamily K member 13-like [Neocloeon triangulifer]|uniref:potassium channel subfamily K member 13-like n=1 Tax=Neocloeon triangulifer TaxID=2078957 RepID=UPI00286EFFC2|nr:potassium channel subfamily K member 13-like [Neocloeon triangulifer]